MATFNIQHDCDRIVRAAIAEPDAKKQVVMLLQWIVDTGKAGDLYVVPPLDAMLGLTGPVEKKAE